jgi:hypothetical protein
MKETVEHIIEDVITRHEFAKRCGVAKSYINTYIKRKKISVLKQGDDDFVNLTAHNTIAFASKKGYDISSGYSVAKDPEKKPEPKKKTPDPQNHVPINSTIEDAVFLNSEGVAPIPSGMKLSDFLILKVGEDVDTVKKKIEIQKLVEQAEIEKLKKEKLQGLSIPTELVHAIFHRSFVGITIAFNEGAADLVQRMRHRYGADAKDQIELQTELEGIVNEAVQAMKDTSTSELKSVIEEYKATRSNSK